MAELIADRALTHLPRGWEAADFDGLAIAIAEADDDDAAEFAVAARAAGTPCNVIDRPTFGTFRFGSIVDRSPVVVGIATAGAGPILAQAIRRRAFWETLAENAFGPAPSPADQQALAAGLAEPSAPMAGSPWSAPGPAIPAC